MFKFAMIAVTAALCAGSSVHADLISIFGDAADYEIRMDTMTNALTTDDGGDPILDVLADPGFDAQERRAIFQFDLSTLGDVQSITSASISITLAGVDVFPSQDVDLYGSSTNRASLIFAGDAGAIDEYDDPSYGLLASNFAPVANPFDTDVTYMADISSFLTDRYADWQNNGGESIVFFRLQTQDLFGTSFYDFYSGDSDVFRPEIVVDAVVPAPGAIALLLPGLMAPGRRRRS